LKFRPTSLPGVIEIEPDVHRDERGFFLETYHSLKYADGGIDAVFVQDNHSRTRKGMLRGLHMQLAHPQGKLVRVIEGEVFDVAVDVRRGSPCFGQHVGVVLSAESFRQLYIPPGFAHGFVATSDSAQLEYKCSDLYHPEDDLTIAWNDPDLAIAWPIEDPILSAKDAAGSRLRDVMARLPEYHPEPHAAPSSDRDE
jgi:dTDP-4-dehydrorhamnose 3,5-epimerase